jgi:ribosomal protein S18 acetylase RimI-like enzyme
MTTVDSRPINLRRMTPADIDSVVAIDKRIGKGGGLIDYRDITRAEIGGPFDMSFVAEMDGKVVGTLISRLVLLMLPFQGICLIQTVLVDPDYQHHHIGSKLISALLEQCKKSGVKTVRALVEDRNVGLRNTVERLGFRSSRIFNFDKQIE